MILVKINNPSSIVASRIGRFLADLTPSGFDQQKVEEEFIKQLASQMASQGIQGEVASVRGIDLHNKEVRIEDIVRVKKHKVV